VLLLAAGAVAVLNARPYQLKYEPPAADFRPTAAGLFGGAAFFVLVAVLVLSRAGRARPLGAKPWAAALAGVAATAALAAGDYHNGEPGAAYPPGVVTALRQDPLWGKSPVVVSFPAESWAEALALVLQLDRQGAQVYVNAGEYAFMFPPELTGSGWTEATDVIRLDVHRPPTGAQGVTLAVVATPINPQAGQATQLNVFVNDESVARWEVPTGGDVLRGQVVFPADLVNRRRQAVVKFELTGDFIPDHAPRPESPNRPGLVVNSICLGTTEAP
jgi:hypothetical protein